MPQKVTVSEELGIGILNSPLSRRAPLDSAKLQGGDYEAQIWWIIPACALLVRTT